MMTIFRLMGLIAGFVLLKAWGVIEGTLGPLTQATGSAPVEGTDEVQTLTIGGTPTGGTFKLAFRGAVTAAITWSATNATLVANILAALTGVASVQTITFGGTPTGGTFRLRYKGQETDTITWSSTNNTLRDNVDAALEALGNIGTGGVTTAVGSMTSGIGTLTVTFAVKGRQALIQAIENRLTGTAPTVSVEETTAGVSMPTIGDGAVAVAVNTMTAGIGTIDITFSGTNVAKRAQPLITVAENALTGTSPTLAVTEATPGVDAFGQGLSPGGTVVDTSTGVVYVNEGTANAPDYAAVTTS